MMTDSEWHQVQEKTGVDIMDIVMNFSRGLETAGRTMELISEHCEACYEEGVKRATELFKHVKDENELAKEREAEYERIVPQLRGWIADLQEGTWVNCLYCGHRYGPDSDTPVAMADVLKEHIEKCPDHPMSKLKKENEELRADIQTLLDALRKMDTIFERHNTTKAATVKHPTFEKTRTELIKENKRLRTRLREMEMRGAFGDYD